jgi:hypothetical protein
LLQDKATTKALKKYSIVDILKLLVLQYTVRAHDDARNFLPPYPEFSGVQRFVIVVSLFWGKASVTVFLMEKLGKN